MGFRSTFTTQDYSIKWPDWFREKYAGLISFPIYPDGAIHSIGEEKIGQGAKNAAEYIKEKPEIMDQIEEQVLLFYKTGELPC